LRFKSFATATPVNDAAAAFGTAAKAVSAAAKNSALLILNLSPRRSQVVRRSLGLDIGRTFSTLGELHSKELTRVEG
jgi:hypothetical protein